MRLQAASEHFDIPVFEHTPGSFKMVFGKASEFLVDPVKGGTDSLPVENTRFFKLKKKILIYNPTLSHYEYNEIRAIDQNILQLKDPLAHSYPPNSTIIMLKTIEYKLYTHQNILKRKIDRGYFQPLIEQVSEFYVTFFPESNSVLYKLEISHREQVRGYIFLSNRVQK